MSRTVWLVVYGTVLIIVCVTLGLGVPLASDSYSPSAMVFVWIPCILAAGVLGAGGRFTLAAALRERRGVATGPLLRVARKLVLVGVGIAVIVLVIAVGMGTGTASLVLLALCIVAGGALSVGIDRAAR